jgi:hypothetical protein
VAALLLSLALPVRRDPAQAGATRRGHATQTQRSPA